MDPFVLVLIVMLGFVVLMIAGAGRGKTASPAAPALPKIVELGALLGATIAAVGGIVSAVSAFIGDGVALVVSVIATVEAVPDELRASTGPIIESGLTQQTPMSLTVAGLDFATRTLTALHWAVLAVVAVIVLLSIARVARRSTDAAPFSGALSRSLVASGAAVAIGGTLAQVFSNAAGLRVHAQLFELSSDVAEGSVYAPPGWSFELWPVGVGLVVIVLARLIRSAERLQRDTEGLV